MGRKIGDGVVNQLTIKDRISGQTIGLIYRMPTTEERTRYFASRMVRDKSGIQDLITKTRQEFGAVILTGFIPGSFEKKIGQSWCQMVSDPSQVKDPETQVYDPEWRAFLKQYAADVLEELAFYVFESSMEIAPAQGEAYDLKN
jgi:hypothetical protein